MCFNPLFIVIIIIVIVAVIVIVLCMTKPEQMSSKPKMSYLIAEWRNQDLGMIRIGNPRDNIRIVPNLVDNIVNTQLWQMAQKNQLKEPVDVLSHGAGSGFSETLVMRALVDHGLRVRNWYFVDPWIKTNQQMWARLKPIIRGYTNVEPKYLPDWVSLDNELNSHTKIVPLLTVSVHARDDPMDPLNDELMERVLGRAFLQLSLSIAGHNNLAMTLRDQHGMVEVKKGEIKLGDIVVN